MLLLLLNITGLFVILMLLGWLIHLARISRGAFYRPFTHPTPENLSLSVIIPVVDEPDAIWEKVLWHMKAACAPFDHEIIIVANGKNSENNAKMAESMGFTVVRMGKANKRLAVGEGARRASKAITIILDSDTIVPAEAMPELLKTFHDPKVGGATPRHSVFDRDIGIRWVSDWLEDLRFEYAVQGQSVGGAVSCLPGRLFAMRTSILKDCLEEFLYQTFWGQECVTGDDRFLTSCILQRGYKAVYQASSLVYTDAPSTVNKFILQRLRWSRSGLRETILSIPWMWRYPYMTFTVLAEYILRWFFVYLMVFFILHWTGILPNETLLEQLHASGISTPLLLLGVLGGAFINSFLHQLGYMLRKPENFKRFPKFFFYTTFVLAPVEVWGNLSFWVDKWMTRRTDTTPSASVPVATNAEMAEKNLVKAEP
jgi:hyaluronan synthase